MPSHHLTHPQVTGRQTPPAKWTGDPLRILIIGAGAVGFYLAGRLADEAQEITIVDVNPERIERVRENLDVLAIHGSGADVSTLEEAGIRNAEIVMAVSGSEEVNLLACFAASRAGVGVKVARVRHPEHHLHTGLFAREALGVDFLVGPEQECAREIFHLLATPAATDIATFAGGQVQLVGMRVLPDAPLAADTLARLPRELSDRHFVVTALVRGDQTQIPTGATRLRPGDRAYILARTEDLGSLPGLAGHEPVPLTRVMIAGGSDEAVYLARHLRDHGVHCTILDRDPSRCRELAESLPGALVLRGDATDMELLEMEGVEGTDGFVALTDRDEVNMLVALLAKNSGARRVIPLIHKEEYMDLVDRMGLDAAVSPRISAANAILRHVRRGSVASVATLKGGRAEAIETVIAPEAPIAGKRVRDIRFPKGAMLGILVKGNEVIIPRGQDSVEAGDLAIFFVLPHALEAVGRLLE